MDNWKNVLIVGYGKSGQSVENILRKKNVSYKIFDDNIKINGGNYLSKITRTKIKEFDLVILSPGFSLKNPIIKLAKANDIKCIGELEFGYYFLKQNLISVTGTNGKTTTVNLINNILNSCKKSNMAGNVGIPFSDVAFKNDCDYIVCEVSSFQLESIFDYRSNVNVLLNISDDHLDRYGKIENYISAKSNIFKNNTEKTVNILNFDDEIIKSKFFNVVGLKYFISQKEIVKGVYVLDNKIYINIGKNKNLLCDVDSLKIPKLFLPDVLASICVGVLMNIPNESIIDEIKKFKLLKSRMEEVGCFNNVTYINDSKATNMHAVLACVNSIDADIILMLGGRNKGFNFKKLAMFLPKNVKTVLCFGEAKKSIEKAIKHSNIKCYSFNTLDEAIVNAWNIAWPNSMVVLSPACSSFDEFKNYEERGEFFKNKIAKLGLSNDN